MSKDISTGKKAQDFAEAVKGLLGLNAMQSAIEHLRRSKGSGISVIRSYEESYNADSDSKIAQYTQTINRCKQRLADIDSRLERTDAAGIGEEDCSRRASCASVEHGQCLRPD